MSVSDTSRIGRLITGSWRDEPPARASANPRAGLSLSGAREAGLVFILAILVRLVGFGAYPPHPDDLLHLYAARSYLADGTFSIFSGTYARSGDFTWLVAASMRLFGDSLSAARLPSLISGAALVVAVYAWLRSQAGRGPAIITAALLALLAPLIDVSVLIRFYALQSLLFWVGTALLYQVIVAGRPSLATGLLGALGVLALAEAARLQVVSLIGLVGFSAWAILFITWRLKSLVPARALVAAWAVLLVAGGALLFVLVKAGVAVRLYEEYRAVVLWGVPMRDNVRFYYYAMTESYRPLFDLLPVAMLAAVAWYPKPALYCATVLSFGLALHSFAGMKAERYIAYLIPYFIGLWGMASWPLLRILRDRIVALAGAWAQGRYASALATLAVSGFCALVVVKAVPTLEPVARSLLLPGYHRPFGARDWSWEASRAALRPLARQADVFVADDDLLADFHVGRADLVLNKSRLLENNPSEEFARDFRTGTPTISDDASIRIVLSCFNDGVILTDEAFLKWIPDSTLAFIAEHTRALDIALPLVGWAWDAPQGTPAADCSSVRRLVSETAEQRRAAPQLP